MTAGERVPTAQAVCFHPIEEVFTATWDRPLDLQRDAIHVWGFILEGTEAAVERCGSWLDQRERARATRLIRADDRRRYTLAHGSLRAVLGRYLHLERQALEFGSAPTGKPFVSQRFPNGNALAFNLSHAHGRMLIAVSRAREVGVDLELIRRDVEVGKLADRFFCPAEKSVMAETATGREHQTFFHYWVAKEAVLKAQGVGISSLQNCEIVLKGDRAGTEIRVTPGSAIQPDWTVQFIACGPEWEAAVASRGSDWIVQPQSAA